ncbi:MAG TPA: AAA family ATPase, partial [Candidatus Limnocylindrales bacterium]|nr:AAA family ATPase [Candidatus Limnocylindrales bacterium]
MLLLRSLGELRLEGDPLPRLLSPRKELLLLVYAARRAPRPVDRAELAALLWDARRPDRARQSLRQALLDLRRLLPDALEETTVGVRFQADRPRFDVAEFEEALGRGEPAAAVALWGGEFLAGVEDTATEELRVWIEGEREQLRRELRSALEALVGDARDRAASSEAIGWGERWVELLPLDERGHYQLAEALLLAGRPAEARVRYERGRAGLRAAFGAEPSLTFLQLEARIERAVVGSAGRRPAGAALRQPELVGRESALGDLESAWRAVRQGGAATVLVEGEPGVGKSRLTEEFVLRLQSVESAPLVVSVRLGATDRAVALGAVTALVLGLADAPGLGGAPALALAELARLAPGIGGRFHDLPTPAGSIGALAEALAEGLGAVAAERPVVLLLDDVSYADDESAAALRPVLRRLPSQVLAFATARTALGPAAPGRLAFAEGRALHRLELQPLDRDGVRALLDSMLELPAGERDALAGRLHAASGGNPHL